MLQRFGSKKKRATSSRRFDDTSNRWLKSATTNHAKSKSLAANNSVHRNKNVAARMIQSAFRGYRVRTIFRPIDGDHRLYASVDPTIDGDLRNAGIHGSKYRLFRDDGTATVHLRDSISNALKTNRFDNISAMLVHESFGSPRGLDNDLTQDEDATRKYQSLYSTNGNQKMVATITMEPKKQKSGEFVQRNEMKNRADDMSIRDISYSGFEKERHPPKSSMNGPEESTGCFNCWSARQCNKCKLQGESQASETICESKPFCEYWDINAVRQHYRSEDIEADSSTRLSSLRFAKDQRRRSAIAEHQAHPLFMSLSTHIADANHRARRRLHVQRWFRSLVECVKQNMIQGYRCDALAKEMQRKDSLANTKLVAQITREVVNQLPKPPITGCDPMESDIIYQKDIVSIKGEVRTTTIIMPKPIPVPLSLYKAREYLPPLPSRIELGRNSDHIDSNVPLDVIVYGSFGKKSAPNNLAVGGLSSEVMISQKVVTSFPPQYGGFNIIDSSVYTPDPTPESFVPAYISEVDAPKLEYVERPLQHALNHRRVPTIIIKTGISPNERHYFGTNRPEQTGEIKDCGFRTSESVDFPKLNSHLDTKTFVPAQSIVTPNVPQVLPTTSTRANLDYPFCETKSRENNLGDLAHMLEIQRSSTANKPQVFTVMTKQQPGNFMRDCDPTRPLGRLRTNVSRSWSFVHKRRIAMFYTDDGVPYWYDRRTSQTFWERPLYDEELLPVVEGGTSLGNQSNIYIGDNESFSNSVKVRSNTRKMIMSQHENEEERVERDRAARRSRPSDIPRATAPTLQGEEGRKEKLAYVKCRRPMSAPATQTRRRTKTRAHSRSTIIQMPEVRT